METTVTRSQKMVTYFDHTTKHWKETTVGKGDGRFPMTAMFKVTPVWAEKVLENRNTDNRRLSDSRIDQYVADIIAGRWRVNNDDICFDCDGILLNGQHRLAAVVKAQMSVMMSFKFGLDSDVIRTIDEGKKRTNLDVMRIMKEPGTGKTLSATNFVMEQAGRKKRAPRSEQLDFHRRHFDAATFACQLNQKPYARNPVHAALLRSYYHVNRDRLLEFITILNTGIWDGSPANSAAFRLRRFIEANRLGQTGPARIELYFRAEQAIRHFCDRKHLRLLRAASAELFPLPEEQIKQAPAKKVKASF